MLAGGVKSVQRVVNHYFHRDDHPGPDTLAVSRCLNVICRIDNIRVVDAGRYLSGAKNNDVKVKG